MTGRGGIESRNRAMAGKPAALATSAEALRSVALDFESVLGIADALPVMVGYCDVGQHFLFLNQAMADWFEQPRGALLGRAMRDALGPEAYAARQAMIEAALAGERQWFAADYQHPTRGPLAVQTQYIPQFRSDGAVRGFVILVEDITEQRMAGRALKESEARFRRIADSAPVPMWVTRLDRSRDFVNDAYVELMGVDRDEARSMDWGRRIHPDDRQRMAEETRAGEASRASYTLEARFLKHDGHYCWMRSVNQPRFDAGGNLVGYIGVAIDVTVTKEAELALKDEVEKRTLELSESEARLRSIFDTVLEVIVLTEPDGTVVQMNRTTADWRDAHPEAAVGGKIWDAPTMRAFPHHRELMKRAVAIAASGQNFEEQVVMEREGMATAFLDVSLRPVPDERGEIAYLLFEARDITELRAAQEQLRQSQKMEALGQLTGGIAHDFNNLLTVVVGGLDLIAKKVEDPKLKRYADNALAAAERGARLTAQLLAFSRVQKLEVRPTYAVRLIENMRPLLRNVLGPSITKRFDLDPDQFPVMADPTQLELAVLNLAINARDAMPTGGTLCFRSHRVRVADDPEMADGEYLELSISDSGTGMSAEVAARAFEPFFTTKEVGRGTGLGLSMVYGVARQSGGTARIDSTLGEGTTVRLYFPRADHPVEPSQPDEAGEDVVDGHPSAAASILVVDDDAEVRAFVAASLSELGYGVREAADGEAGLFAFDEARPDLVVIDYVMPGLSGAETARRIRERAPGQPVLFISGYSETEAIDRIAPDAEVLAKPFRAEALDAAVRRALAASAARAT